MSAAGARTTAQAAEWPVIWETGELDPGTVLIYKDYGHRVRAMRDPAKLSAAGARQLLAMFVGEVSAR